MKLNDGLTVTHPAMCGLRRPVSILAISAPEEWSDSLKMPEFPLIFVGIVLWSVYKKRLLLKWLLFPMDSRTSLWGLGNSAQKNRTEKL